MAVSAREPDEIMRIREWDKAVSARECGMVVSIRENRRKL